MQQITVLPHSPYSTDLAPCDFDLFLRLKAKLRGCRFHSPEKMITATKNALREMSANANIVQTCFRRLYERWQTCIAANGDYFEGQCGSV